MIAPLGLQQNTWKEAIWELHKDAACCFEQILEATPYKTADVLPLTSYLTNHPIKICWITDGEERTKSILTFPMDSQT